MKVNVEKIIIIISGCIELKINGASIQCPINAAIHHLTSLYFPGSALEFSSLRALR